MTEERRDPKPGEAVSALVGSAMQLSASVAQAVAEAATGKPQQTPPTDTPLQAIVRHGTTAASSIVSTVVSAARSDGQASAPQAPALPTIQPGGTLRVPLSVDNPGDAPMSGLAPQLTSILHLDAPADGWTVVFDPPSLTVGPRDFEKLVVLVDVPEDAQPGPASVSFDLGGGAAPITLRFAVG